MADQVSFPVLVYDDDCGFCTWWARYFEQHVDIPIIGFSELTPSVRDRLPEDYASCSHFVTADRVYSCGASIEEAFRHLPVGRLCSPVILGFRKIRAYRWVRERVYRWVATNRSFWGRLMSATPPSADD